MAKVTKNPIIGIYKIVSPVGRVYIGKSKDIEKRWGHYRKHQNCQKQTRLYRSFLKYGAVNHSFEVLILCTEEELDALEIYYIKLYDSFDTMHGLNLRSGGEGGRCANESKILISKKNKGRKRTEEQKKKLIHTYKRGPDHYLFGKTISEEAKQHLRNINLGKKQTEEVKRKISEAGKGRKASPETIAKLKKPRFKSRGRKMPEEVKKRWSEQRKGKTSHRKGKSGVYKESTYKLWSEQRKGSGNSFFGKKHSKEALLKIQETRKIKGVKKPEWTFEQRMALAHKKGSKPILQYDINGVFIKEWPYQKLITQTLGIPSSNIKKVCQGKSKHAGGYIWKYK